MKEFQTSDLYLAAYCQALGFELLRLDRRGHQGVFVFDLEDESESTIKSDFHSGKGTVSALEYANACKALKALVMT